jgi:hypothetical protein
MKMISLHICLEKCVVDDSFDMYLRISLAFLPNPTFEQVFLIFTQQQNTSSPRDDTSNSLQHKRILPVQTAKCAETGIASPKTPVNVGINDTQIICNKKNDLTRK